MHRRFNLPALEYHVAHGCNLSCQQCSHYSDHHLAGVMPTVEQADADYSKWSHRLKPRRFALLGGEPLLNPQIVQHIQLATTALVRQQPDARHQRFLSASVPRVADGAL